MITSMSSEAYKFNKHDKIHKSQTNEYLKNDKNAFGI